MKTTMFYENDYDGAQSTGAGSESMLRVDVRLFLRFLSILFFLLFLTVPPAVSAAEHSFSEDANAVEAAADSVFMLEVYSSRAQKIGVGSGFVAFDSSLLVTNYHVIDGGAYVVAISDDYAQSIVTEVCAYDRSKDIAILRFDNSAGSAPLEMDAQSTLKRSQKVVAIGSPAGLMNTISIGNISAFYRNDGKDWIQFTAPISAGSSGGALLSDEGKVIGMTTATYTSAQNVNMAVKAKDIVTLYDRWDGRTTVRMGSVTGGGSSAYPSIPAATSPGMGADNGTTVYVTSSGSRYHNNPSCSRMKNPIEMDLLDAIERGYEPCGKCYK
ncbi:MAG: serine protease [Clostridia bacterium]|nr:serine protease [Clostridia bacterium]